MMAKHGWRVDRAVHNYLYFIFYYPYVRFLHQLFSFLGKYMSWFKPLNPVISMSFARYHAKVISGADAVKIFELNEDVSAVSDNNKRIVPFDYAYKILLQEPDFIAVMDCPCKKTLKAPDSALNSCISVGSKTSRFWIDQCGKKYNARKISQKEALDMIKKFRAEGYITQAFFKVATGGSTGVICNCHKDYCVSLKATQAAKKFRSDFSMAADSGYSCLHDPEKCRQCETCARICQFDAVEFNGDSRTYKKEICMGCGLCMEHCPEGAVQLYRDARKTVPLDMDIVKKEYASLQ